MRTRTIEELLDEYLEKNPELKKKYSKKEIRDICTFPFRIMRQVFVKGSLEKIRLKYLGVFKISKGTVENYLKKLKIGLDNGTITEEQYKCYIKNYENYENKINS